MGENNKQDIQNGNTSSMPDMKSGYPTSGMPYPMSGMPYPVSGMPYVIKVKQKKMSTGTFAAIAIGIVVAFAAIAVALILIFGNKSDKVKNRDGNKDNDSFIDNEQMSVVALPDQDEYLKYAVTGKVIIDGTEYNLDEGMYNIDNSNMVSVGEFGKMFGFTCKTDVSEGKITLTYDGIKYVFRHNDVLCKKYGTDGKESSIGITKKALMFSNGKMYVSVRGLMHIFMFESVGNENGILSIVTNGDITVK